MTRGNEPRFAYWRAELRERRDALRKAFFTSPDTPLLLREHSRIDNRKLIDLATAVVDGHRLLPSQPQAPPRA